MPWKLLVFIYLLERVYIHMYMVCMLVSIESCLCPYAYDGSTDKAAQLNHSPVCLSVAILWRQLSRQEFDQCCFSSPVLSDLQ